MTPPERMAWVLAREHQATAVVRRAGRPRRARTSNMNRRPGKDRRKSTRSSRSTHSSQLLHVGVNRRARLTLTEDWFVAFPDSD